MNPKVDSYLRRQDKWKKAFTTLREIILSTGLDEELKWGHPTYSDGGKNVILMHGFKEYCAVLFPKGALLKDPKHVLVQQTKNVQAARQIRFTSVAEVEKLAKTLKAYIREAIQLERAGLRVPMKKTEDYVVPEELQKKLARDRSLKAAFSKLTPGRQRGYIYFVSQAKQAKTREARVEKCAPKILEGLGWDE